MLVEKEITAKDRVNPVIKKLQEENQRLKEELLKYQLFIDNSFDMQRLLLLDGTLAYISPSCLKITGYSQEEHYEKPLLLREIIHPDDKEKFEIQLEACYKGEITEPDIARIIRKDGVIAWIGIAIQHVIDKEGNLLGFHTSTRDMTQQSELELELERSNKFYSRIVNDQIDLIYRLKPDGTITFVNKATENFFRLNRVDIVGKNFRSFFNDEIIMQGESIVESLSVDKPIEKIIYNYTFPEGSIADFEIIIQGFFEEGNLNEIQVISRDITDSLQAIRQLKLSDERYRAVVESQSDLILRYRPDSEVVFANKAFLRFTGLNSEDIIGRKWSYMAGQEVYNRIEKQMNSRKLNYPSITSEVAVKRHDGEKRIISWLSNAIFDEAGNHIESQTVGHDITELKEAERSLAEALNEVNELKQQLEEENKYLRDKYTSVGSGHGIHTESGLMKEVLAKVDKVSKTDSPVLIFGETGTGKELIAQAIHNSSKRKRKLMITVNCAALPASLIESELFGREKGAYTGALSREIGRFQLADESTIFLDEIGELPLEIQVKLLRVLQFGEFQMLGSPHTKKVNVRLIAATNRDLNKAIEEKTFRSDLFYRLNVFPIKMPPLRDRMEDIPLISWSFIDEISKNIGKPIEKISPKGMSKLLRYSWPGNVRELRNIIEYNMIICNSHILDIQLPESSESESPVDNLDGNQRQHIEHVLSQTGWRIRGKGGAAERLGMKESTLRYRMKKLGVVRRKT